MDKTVLVLIGIGFSCLVLLIHLKTSKINARLDVLEKIDAPVSVFENAFKDTGRQISEDNRISKLISVALQEMALAPSEFHLPLWMKMLEWNYKVYSRKNAHYYHYESSDSLILDRYEKYRNRWNEKPIDNPKR